MNGSDDSGVSVVAMQGDANPSSAGPSQKAMLRVVTGLGIILALLFLALIAGIIWKAQNRKVELVPDVVVSLGIDPASIKQMTLSGNVLALTTDREVVVVDVAKRVVMMRGRP